MKEQKDGDITPGTAAGPNSDSQMILDMTLATINQQHGRADSRVEHIFDHVRISATTLSASVQDRLNSRCPPLPS